MTENFEEEPTSSDEKILVNKGILEEMLLYIQESEVIIDAHEGQGRTWEELIKIYALPDVYYKIKSLLNK